MESVHTRPRESEQDKTWLRDGTLGDTRLVHDMQVKLGLQEGGKSSEGHGGAGCLSRGHVKARGSRRSHWRAWESRQSQGRKWGPDKDRGGHGCRDGTERGREG